MIGRVLFAAGLLSLVPVMALPQAAVTLRAEQTHFSAEDEAARFPVPIPADVMAQLAQDSFVRDVMRSTVPLLKQPPPSWLSASSIHLAGPSESDLVVMAEGGLRGANVVNFWIFRLLPGGAQLVLNGPAHDLTMMRRRRNGLREAELESANATRFHRVVLRFDGNRYAVFTDNWEDIK